MSILYFTGQRTGCVNLSTLSEGTGWLWFGSFHAMACRQKGVPGPILALYCRAIQSPEC